MFHKEINMNIKLKLISIKKNIKKFFKKLFKMKLDRADALNKINKTILQEHGKPVTEDSLLKNCELDSLGYLLLWLYIENDIIVPDELDEVFFTEEYVDNINYKTYTVKELLDKLEELYYVR